MPHDASSLSKVDSSFISSEVFPVPPELVATPEVTVSQKFPVPVNTPDDVGVPARPPPLAETVPNE
jgi:hypothetical protein